MEKEIGGYLQLETFTGKEYYPDLYKVNLGRTALQWILEARKCKKLWLPYFLCDSVIGVCEKMQMEIGFYHLDEELNPVLETDLGADEWLYLVNYYGHLSDKRILVCKEKYGRVIVDHTHSFFQRPIPGIDTLYSCRKFFGLPDGAYVSTDADLDMDKPLDISGSRMTHILGRFEEGAGSYYQQMLDNASTYHQEEIRLMSKLTENLLRGIDYEMVRRKRTENYLKLKELLPSGNPFVQAEPDGPFAYPYYHEKGIELRKYLASHKIFVPTNWSNVIRDMPKESLEYQWAANILPLPCDQRYGFEEMEKIASVIKEFE